MENLSEFIIGGIQLAFFGCVMLIVGVMLIAVGIATFCVFPAWLLYLILNGGF